MKAEVLLQGLLVAAAIVGNVRTGTVGISAYANVPTGKDELIQRNSTNNLDVNQGTGRASIGGYQFPYNGFLSKPIGYRTSSYQDSYKSPKYIVYPSNYQSVDDGSMQKKNNMAMDRFAPGEAYGGTVYKILKAKQKGYQYPKPSGPALDDSAPSSANAPSMPSAPAATTVQALPPPITPPQLPPIIVAPTPVPTLKAADVSNSAAPVSSYLPPSLTELHKFPPNSDLSWNSDMDAPSYSSMLSSYLGPEPPNGTSAENDDMVGTIAVGPGHPQYLPPNTNYLPPQMMDTAPKAMPQMDSMPQMAPMSAMAPMAPMDPIPPEMFQFNGYHDYPPEYWFDPHHDETTTTTTTAAPAPVNVGSPRVKNYSYYYISRTLWYVPLYFTLYFCFYVLILILRSIARHKVNIPNQWVGSRSFDTMPRWNNEQVMHKTNVMTSFVMRQIEDFAQKYYNPEKEE
ncbi:arginine-glutamic acid dipeptide repeats protein [Uranotaenia lowii]|uniref:arginine-glutamic acid dipeptide repeats protein n=1 Tax=Uranotaenia lowii TaxID=190385 RepID=UPI002479F69E|nr:arginine-glutamic acid dipeptide repeats protein [Uranotaenia lowii]